MDGCWYGSEPLGRQLIPRFCGGDAFFIGLPYEISTEGFALSVTETENRGSVPKGKSAKSGKQSQGIVNRLYFSLHPPPFSYTWLVLEVYRTSGLRISDPTFDPLSCQSPTNMVIRCLIMLSMIG